MFFQREFQQPLEQQNMQNWYFIISFNLSYICHKQSLLSFIYMSLYIYGCSIYFNNKSFQFVNIDIVNFKILCTLHIICIDNLFVRYLIKFHILPHIIRAFHSGVGGVKLEWQFALCSAAVECPDHATERSTNVIIIHCTCTLHIDNIIVRLL